MHKPITILALATLAGATSANAQSVVLARSVIASGGGTLTAPGLTFFGTAGQYAVGPAYADTVTFVGGYWGGRAPPNRCPADLDDGSGTGTPDGGVTIDDLLFFLDIYAQGNIRADLDDGSGLGIPDGGVTIDDLLFFLDRYQSGC